MLSEGLGWRHCFPPAVFSTPVFTMCGVCVYSYTQASHGLCFAKVYVCVCLNGGGGCGFLSLTGR